MGPHAQLRMQRVSWVLGPSLILIYIPGAAMAMGGQLPCLQERCVKSALLALLATVRVVYTGGMAIANATALMQLHA